MSGRKSRDKGASAERDVAARLRSIWPACRRRASGDETMEDQGRDLLHTPGYCIQVKCSGKPQPLAALREAGRAMKNGEIPMAIVRQSSRAASTGWCVVMRLEDWLLLGAATPAPPDSSS